MNPGPREGAGGGGVRDAYPKKWGPLQSKIEEFRHNNRRFIIKGCIISYIVSIFSSSELVKPHTNPSKVRLAVALKEGAKWQVNLWVSEFCRFTAL